MSTFRELDPGTYNLHSGPNVVGAVYVEAGPALDTTVEHYILFPPYNSPSYNPSVGSINDVVIRAVAWQNVAPNAATIRPAGIVGPSDFFAILGAFAATVGGSFKYVRADCFTQDGVPSP